MSKNKIFKAVLALFAAIAVTACNTTGSKTAVAKKAPAKPFEIYEVHHDGRINIFYQRAMYKDFMKLGETPFRLTRIGAGPNGQTLVFGLTRKDKKLKNKVAAIELYSGNMKAPANFYAEMRRHGRIYVFNNFRDMQPVRQFGHPNFFYMQVGAGPRGETVVYVLNSKNKKKKPVALIQRFKAMNAK